MKILKVVLIILIALYLIYEIILFIKIDICLDRGGAWNYPKGFCVLDNNISINEIKCFSEKGNWDINNNICEK